MGKSRALAVGAAVVVALVLGSPDAASATWVGWDRFCGHGETWGGLGGANDGYWGGTVDLSESSCSGALRVQLAYSGSPGWVNVLSSHGAFWRRDDIFTGTYHVYARMCDVYGCTSPVVLVDDGT